MLCMQNLFFKAGGLIDDVHIFTKGKSINAEKDENVELTRSQVFCGRLCVLFE